MTDVPLVAVSASLGHSSATSTAFVYQHVSKTLVAQRTAKAIEKAYGVGS